MLHKENYLQEGALRGGHIPTAIHSERIDAMAEDGKSRSYNQLAEIFLQNLRLSPDDEVIVYCRNGERAALTRFVLSYLPGFKNVRNSDGSWTEWVNPVGAPIADSVNRPQKIASYRAFRKVKLEKTDISAVFKTGSLGLEAR